MNTDFPEEYFQPIDQSVFDWTVTEGIDLCRNKSILFCGVIRNVEKTLKRNLERILKTGSYFREFDIFFYENDSSDNTKAILNTSNIQRLYFQSENNKFNYSENSGNESFTRCQRIAIARNKYVDFIKANRQKYDYIAIIDMDLIGGWSYAGFVNSIHVLRDKNVGCCTAYGVLGDFTGTIPLEQIDLKNNKHLMYDSFAFRRLGCYKPLTNQDMIYHNQIKIRWRDTPFNVRSNFNGLGIYKANLFDDFNYFAKKHNIGHADCDHVSFHDHINKLGFNVTLNPSLITSYSQHRHCYD